MLSVMEKMSSDEICQELEITLSNLWVRLHRARLALAQCVELPGSAMKKRWGNMPNDRETSELISCSLSQNLPTAQEQVIRDGVSASDESKKFESISRLIQGSLSDVARWSAESDPEVSPGLSDEARERLRNFARLEQSRIYRVEEKTVVPSDSTFRRSNSETSVEPEGAENRQLTSHFRIQRPLGLVRRKTSGWHARKS